MLLRARPGLAINGSYDSILSVNLNSVRPFECRSLPFEFAIPKMFANGPQEFPVIPGFREDREETVLASLKHRSFPGEPRQQDPGRGRPESPGALEKRGPACAWQPVVGDQHADAAFSKPFERLAGIRGRQNLVRFLPERPQERAEDRRLIIQAHHSMRGTHRA